jgi:hypothetical protein
MTDSDMLDLYEAMLSKRVVKRIRPVLYISSSTDLECSVLMLLNEAPELRLAGTGPLPPPVFGQRARTS